MRAPFLPLAAGEYVQVTVFVVAGAGEQNSFFWTGSHPGHAIHERRACSGACSGRKMVRCHCYRGGKLSSRYRRTTNTERCEGHARRSWQECTRKWQWQPDSLRKNLDPSTKFRKTHAPNKLSISPITTIFAHTVSSQVYNVHSYSTEQLNTTTTAAQRFSVLAACSCWCGGK